MPARKPTPRTVEFGDFQTPVELARRCCRLLAARGCAPRAVVEPTCGVGAFLQAADEVWRPATLAGFEIDAGYGAEARRTVPRATVQRRDFFGADWRAELAGLAGPVLVLGNPPWVTNAALGAIGGGRPRAPPRRAGSASAD